jgi:hypothetical protein
MCNMKIDASFDRHRLTRLIDQLVLMESPRPDIQDWSPDKTRRVVAAMVEAGISIPADDLFALLRTPGIIDTIQSAVLRREFASRAERVTGSFAVV